ncbi:carbohydrate-binding protein [Marinobacter arenosus]|uniref:carbohydrate-binding protein n=1 Tax=Marinobacter arenosus TaxID=2856822 RepID=UPI001C4D6C53|nr:carbohydrate-binding protein [Marinobacter arenosus]MBW0147958.1 carbohydrate-binding protein [Marinobacter arenosus]
MFSKRNSHPFVSLLLLLVGLGLTTTALAKPCDPDESGWLPSRYYTAGAAVFYEGQWFEARQISEGKEPGISFDWKELDEAPECDAEQRAKQKAAEETTVPPVADPTSSDGDEPTVCERPEQWRFAESYIVGSLATHGGMVWEAIRPTSGDMPGMTEPPRWREVEDHCSLKQMLSPETQ